MFMGARRIFIRGKLQFLVCPVQTKRFRLIKNFTASAGAAFNTDAASPYHQRFNFQDREKLPQVLWCGVDCFRTFFVN